MNQALYPVEKIEWCIYALFEQDTDRIGTYCTIVTSYHHADVAQSLDGYLWAVSTLKEEKMRISCLEDSHLEDILSPLTIIQVGNGCEGYSSNLFLPAKSKLTSEDETLTWHVFFLHFNEEISKPNKIFLNSTIANTATNPRRIKDPPRSTNCTTTINPDSP